MNIRTFFLCAAAMALYKALTTKACQECGSFKTGVEETTEVGWMEEYHGASVKGLAVIKQKKHVCRNCGESKLQHIAIQEPGALDTHQYIIKTVNADLPTI